MAQHRSLCLEFVLLPAPDTNPVKKSATWLRLNFQPSHLKLEFSEIREDKVMLYALNKYLVSPLF